MREFDIRTVGRHWSAEETTLLHDDLPGHLEMVNGMHTSVQAARFGGRALSYGQIDNSKEV